MYQGTTNYNLNRKNIKLKKSKNLYLFNKSLITRLTQKQFSLRNFLPALRLPRQSLTSCSKSTKEEENCKSTNQASTLSVMHRL